MDLVSRLFSYVLVLFGIVMTGWGALGLLEYFTGLAVIALQNPHFPPGMQFLHFLVIFSSGAVFLTGYATRWPGTPLAMVVAFTALASLCAVQTLDFLVNDSRYILFAQELVNYTIISLYLFRSQRMRAHFAPRPALTEARA